MLVPSSGDSLLVLSEYCKENKERLSHPSPVKNKHINHLSNTAQIDDVVLQYCLFFNPSEDFVGMLYVCLFSQ